MKRSVGEHWQERTSYYVDPIDPDQYVDYPELVLLSNDPRDDDSGRVLSISIEKGVISFEEKCDSYYHIDMSPEDAITALEEAIAWIREQQLDLS